MKKILMTGLFCKLFVFVAFSQYEEHNVVGNFTKIIEYNLHRDATSGYNFKNKPGGGKVFFGDFNAPVEFFFTSMNEIGLDAEGAFRIMRDSLDKNYVLDIRHQFPKIDRSYILISDQFAEKMHKKMSSFIWNFKAKERGPNTFEGYKILFRAISICYHCGTVTFRTVVDDEVWTLNIYAPQDKARKMADMCTQIIEETKGNNFEEAKYLELLDQF